MDAHLNPLKLGKYLSLEEFCTCTQTYQKYRDRINPYPQTAIPETLLALEALNTYILDPIIDYFGRSRFCLTYGFCSPDLKKFLEKKDPITGLKNGRVAPNLDQHIAHELKKTGDYYCPRLGAACDFLMTDLPSTELVEWILSQKLPFDSLYFYGVNRPIHISYGPQHKQAIWTFTPSGKPTQKNLEPWLKQVKK